MKSRTRESPQENTILRLKESGNKTKQIKKTSTWTSYVNHITETAAKHRNKRSIISPERAPDKGMSNKGKQSSIPQTDGFRKNQSRTSKTQRTGNSGSTSSIKPTTSVYAPKGSKKNTELNILEVPSVPSKKESSSDSRQIAAEDMSLIKSDMMGAKASSMEHSVTDRIDAISKRLETLAKENEKLRRNEIQLRKINTKLLRKLWTYKNNSNITDDAVSLDSTKSVLLNSANISCFVSKRMCRLHKKCFSLWRLFNHRRQFTRIMMFKRKIERLSLILRSWGCFAFLERIYQEARSNRDRNLVSYSLRVLEEHCIEEKQLRRKMKLATKFYFFNRWIKYLNYKYLKSSRPSMNRNANGAISLSPCSTSSCSLPNKSEGDYIFHSQLLLQRLFSDWKTYVIRRYNRRQRSLLESLEDLKSSEKMALKSQVFSRFKSMLLFKRSKANSREKKLAMLSMENICSALTSV